MRGRDGFAILGLLACGIAGVIFPIWGIIVEAKVGRLGVVLPGAIFFYAIMFGLLYWLFNESLFTEHEAALAICAFVWIVALIVWDFHIDNDYNNHRCTLNGQFVPASYATFMSGVVCKH